MHNFALKTVINYIIINNYLFYLKFSYVDVENIKETFLIFK